MLQEETGPNKVKNGITYFYRVFAMLCYALKLANSRGPGHQ